MEDKNVCENCEKECEELVTRHGFIMTFFVEWVCKNCFEEIEGIAFDRYTGEDYGREL